MGGLDRDPVMRIAQRDGTRRFDGVELKASKRPILVLLRLCPTRCYLDI